MYNRDLIIQYIINKLITQKLEERKNTFYVQMNVTTRCTENCKHCYLRRNNFVFNEASALDFIDIINQVYEWSHKESKKIVIDLIGGDPLVKHDIDMILNYLYKINVDYGIKGNPYLLFDNINKLVDLRCSSYQMSLDGLENTHDSLRSENSYKSTLSAIKLLNKFQIPVKIKFTLSNKNIKDLWPLLYSLYEENVNVASFSVARYYENNNNGFHITQEYYEEAYKNLVNFYNMQINNKKIRIYINLKEHLWIPFLVNKQYLLKNFYKLVRDTPYISSCSMYSMNTTIITADGFYDVCPKVSNFGKVKDIYTYMEKKKNI